MGKRILIILGHHSQDSYCSALADAYASGAAAAGNDVKRLAIGELSFDPVIRDASNQMMILEPDLLAAQEAIIWAQHIVIVYPIWWGGPSALLKGFFDRVFLPGFAFSFREGSPMWDKLLSGRSAHVIATMDTPPWYYRWFFRDAGNNLIKRTILEFCGIKPVRVTSIGSIKGSSSQKRQQWLESMCRDGKRA